MSIRIAFIGMGEAGSAIVSGWSGGHIGRIKAYDIKTDDPATKGFMEGRYSQLGVVGTYSPEDAASEADIIFSTVTADQAINAAESTAKYISPGTYWCDLNSCAPSSKQKASTIIEQYKGRYIDVAVMAPVFPMRNMVPLLVSGSHAKNVEPILTSLPMAPTVVSEKVGVASSIKMIRSTFVKSLEALTSEFMLAALAAGVEREVLESLKFSHPGTDWDALTAHNFERIMVHGERRASEMEEVAKTLTDLGLPSDMATAAVRWQRRIGGLKEDAPQNPKELGAKVMAGLILNRIIQI